MFIEEVSSSIAYNPLAIKRNSFSFSLNPDRFSQSINIKNPNLSEFGLGLNSFFLNSNNNLLNSFSLIAKNANASLLDSKSFFCYRNKSRYDGGGVTVASEPVELLVWVRIPAAILVHQDKAS